MIIVFIIYFSVYESTDNDALREFRGWYKQIIEKKLITKRQIR